MGNQNTKNKRNSFRLHFISEFKLQKKVIAHPHPTFYIMM